MKHLFKSILRGGLLIAMPLLLTSCDGLFGSFDNPLEGDPTSVNNGNETPSTDETTPTSTPYATNEYKKYTLNADNSITPSKETAPYPPSVITDETNVQNWEGWYVVSADATISNSIILNNNTYLILCDGATLTVNGNITKSGDYGLYIYGQSEGTGRLVVTYAGHALSGLTCLDVHGGDISVESTLVGGYAAVFNTPINMYGGKLTAQSTAANGYGIHTDNHVINVYGGDIVAKSNGNGVPTCLAINLGSQELTVYGGTVKASSNLYAIAGWIKSGKSGIKFYGTDTEDSWGDGTSYPTATQVKADGTGPLDKKYVKAE